MEIEVVVIGFENTNQQYICVAEQQFNLKDNIIVNTEDGLKVASIKKANYKTSDKESISNVKIQRLVNKEDEKRIKDNAEKEKFFRKETEKLIQKLNLNMKMVEVNLNFDGTKALFSYVSEDRVDFRELVKLMAAQFKTRIELKQIGVRDEAKIVGGLGPCGRVCCCKGHLTDFANVSIKMAKTQNLSLNPQKTSGLCGRLMCCLSYENEYYKNAMAEMPRINSKVQTEVGEGTVVYLDIFKNKVNVKFVDENNVSIKEFSLDEIKKYNKHLTQNKTEKQEQGNKKTDNND